MKKLSPIIVGTIRRMVAYVLLAFALGIFAESKKLGGYEGYVLDALLALAFVLVAEYRAARAELLLAKALAAGQPERKAEATLVKLSETAGTRPVRPSRPIQAVAPPASSYQPAKQQAPVPPHRNIKFPALSILKYMALAFLLFYLALIAYFSGW